MSPSRLFIGGFAAARCPRIGFTTSICSTASSCRSGPPCTSTGCLRSSSPPTDPPRSFPAFSAAIERGGIFYGVPGESREEVLAAVTRLPGIPAGIDRQLLHQLLVAREALASTSVGDGIALPHPRDPVVVRVDQPAVFLCFLERPVDFGALDGRPVRVLCMLLSPSVRDHLQILARLAAALHDETFKELLHAAAPREGILNHLRAVEGERGQGC